VAICDPLAKAQELEARAKNKRLDAWNSIKQASPEMAQFMTEINLKMGKSAFIKVIVDDEIVLKQGIEQGVRDMTVPKSRGRW
jgi:hypothetical protein